LIATSYQKSPIVGKGLSVDSIEGLKPSGKEPYAIEINEVPDHNNKGAIDISDVEYLLKKKANTARSLQGDEMYGGGDFRSSACVELLKQADIVITNPPFSLFREFVAQLVAHDKLFLIVGSKNAITYKDIFRLVKEGKLWLGHGFANGNAFFSTPKEYAREFAAGVYDEKTGLVKFRNVGWFTNMDHSKRHEELPTYKKYSAGEYQKYDNYDAIEVGKVADIPFNYTGVMGVPITFLDKYNPNQFEVIGLAAGNIKGLAGIPSKTGKDGPYMNGKLKYGRILIRKRV
jgi:hypothetical protein